MRSFLLHAARIWSLNTQLTEKRCRQRGWRMKKRSVLDRFRFLPRVREAVWFEWSLLTEPTLLPTFVAQKARDAQIHRFIGARTKHGRGFARFYNPVLSRLLLKHNNYRMEPVMEVVYIRKTLCRWRSTDRACVQRETDRITAWKITVIEIYAV